MAKTLYGHQIGANINEKDAGQSVKIVPDNKTLIALPFNDDHDAEVDPVNLKSMKEIFAHYQPHREVEFKDLEGDGAEITLQFNSLKDFTKEGIIAQSSLLQGLEQQEEVYAKFTDILQTNEKLRNVLSSEEGKKDFLELVDLLISELE